VEGLEWVAVAMSDRVLMRAIEGIAVKRSQGQLVKACFRKAVNVKLNVKSLRMRVDL
jgi:hypothetical protein